MRQVLSTALVALVVGALAGASVSALAQSEPESVSPAVSDVNAHRVDGKHAVGAGASKAKRAGKLVATNKNGLLPANIVNPRWEVIQGKPAFLADGNVGWGEVIDKPAGFADGVDDEGITGITITRVNSSNVNVAAGGFGSAFADCPAGARATGGGFFASNQTAFNLGQSRAISATRWLIDGRNTGASQFFIFAHVVCITTEPSTAIATATKGMRREQSR